MTYSRFSVSLDRSFDEPLKRLGVAFDHFETFEAELEAAKGGKVKNGRKLRAGPVVLEWVFQEAEVDLGGRDAEFGFTLWYLPDGRASRRNWQRSARGAIDPSVVEISFDFKTDDGRVDADVSRRALRLFNAMQRKLPIDRRATSKTALALPPRG